MERPASIRLDAAHQSQFQRRIACDNHTVAAVAIIPFWLDVIAHGPVKVINDQWGTVHPRRPFIVLTCDRSSANDTVGVWDVLGGRGDFQLCRAPRRGWSDPRR